MIGELTGRRRHRPAVPLDLARTLQPLRRGGAYDPTFRVTGSMTWRATRNLAGAVTMSVRSDGDWLDFEAWGPGADLALERAPVLVGAEDDWSAFQPAHPLLRDLARRNPGIRLCRSEAVFEALVPTVMEQKVIGIEARRGYARLVRALGEPAPGPGRLLLPPSPDTLARTPYWRFHPFAVEQRRAETIIRTASSAARLEQLCGGPAEDARATLQSIPGLGPWSANEVTLLALGDPDAVPVGDFHLPNAVCHALAGEARGDDARMLELLEPYRGHRARVVRLLVAGHLRAPRFGPRLSLRHLERH
ncbi:MAG: DNA-3-methyladenine glycosylase [Candidatus Dormibacteria bacterium]